MLRTHTLLRNRPQQINQRPPPRSPRTPRRVACGRWPSIAIVPRPPAAEQIRGSLLARQARHDAVGGTRALEVLAEDAALANKVRVEFINDQVVRHLGRPRPGR